jgi:hypothetical protein
MAGSRTLKLSILGDVDNLTKSLKTATTDVDSFGDKMGKAGKAIGAAFAAAAVAAGAYAIKIGIDGVKAAIEDEKAQLQLALALQSATNATDGQIKATEDAILQMSLATGVADDDLRPALQRLVVSTGSITKAQELLALALDVSAATGKPLETVTNALAKANDGQTTALAKLGVGITAAQAKTMSFTDIQGKLTDLWGGAAGKSAETFEGKIARLSVAFNETKETIGVALLPILDTLLTFINTNALPIVKAFSDSFSLKSETGLGKTITDVAGAIKSFVMPIFDGMKSAFDKIKTTITENKDEFQAFFDVIKYAAPIIGSVIGKAFDLIGSIASVVLNLISNVLAAIKPLLNTAIDGINTIITGINLIKPGEDIKKVPKIGDGFATSGAPGAIKGGGSTSGSTGGATTGGGFTGGGTTGGGSTGGTTGTGATGGTGGTSGVAVVAAKAAAAITDIAGAFDNFTSGTQSLAAIEAASNRAFAFGTSGVNTNSLAGILAASAQPAAPTINVTINGAMDKEGTARTLVETLNNAYYRGTGGANSLVGI